MENHFQTVKAYIYIQITESSIYVQAMTILNLNDKYESQRDIQVL